MTLRVIAPISVVGVPVDGSVVLPGIGMFRIEGGGVRATVRRGAERGNRRQQGERAGRTQLDHGASSSFMQTAIVCGGKKIARHPMWKHPMPGATSRFRTSDVLRHR